MSSEEFKLMLCDLYEMDLYFPKSSFYIKDFTKASYSVWAIQELGNYVGFCLGPPGTVRTTDEIINYVKKFQKEMFSIAKDIATNVLDVLLAMK